VPPVRPDPPPPPDGAVDRPRHADGEAAEATTERPRVIGLDDEVQVIVLCTVVDHAEVLVRGGRERAADGEEDARGSEAADGRTAAEGDVNGVRSDVRWPRAVCDARPVAGG